MASNFSDACHAQPDIVDAMDKEVTVLFAANREGRVEIVYYCPTCEAVNELIGRDTRILLCRECKALLTARHASIEVIHEQPEEQEKPGAT